MLEIGSGGNRLPGFETLDIVPQRNVDYVIDTLAKLPFADQTFDVVFASHVLEHLPWYLSGAVVSEWARILKPGGRLEIWLPDGEMIARVILEASDRGTFGLDDGWRVRNETGDPFLWANGRLFYGANPGYPSWHQSTFTERSLCRLMESVGLEDVRRARPEEFRGGSNQGPINLGVFGARPCR